jgi:hypothetical protein
MDTEKLIMRYRGRVDHILSKLHDCKDHGEINRHTTNAVTQVIMLGMLLVAEKERVCILQEFDQTIGD